ncbi:MAG: hypothetical protein KTR30_13560 [Saprospiraceae bacterium]|nr:hypothetical protein [Saprospiraceae bacterium]
MLEKLFQYLGLLGASCLSLLKVLLRSNLLLRTPVAQEKECVILGNGPSLKKLLAERLEDLQGKDLICVNKFPDTAFFTQLKPKYFIFVSPEYWVNDPANPNTAIRQNIINALIEKSSWEITLFCPYKGKKAKEWVSNIRRNKNIKIVFFNDTPIEGLFSWNRIFMANGWGLPRPHNVLIPAITMAINSGYKRIYLAGADHSWLPMISVNDKNQALVNQQHFYDENATKSDLMYKLGMRPRRLHEILEKFMFTFRSYFVLKDYAESRGATIYNSTPDSYIDAFERKPISGMD